MLRNSTPVSFVPAGVTDAYDQNGAFPGACQQIANGVFDRQNRGAIVSRPGVTAVTSFAGFTTPGTVSAALTVGTRIYGMIASGRNAGFDEPFCWDTATSAFVTISGVLASNVPTTPATTGAWTPPTMDVVGTKILVTHPGLSGANLIGWFDTASFSATPTATTTATSATLTAVSSTTGILNGMAISGTGIPANSVVLSTTSTTIVISNAATASGTVTVTVTGGTQAAPAWGAGNTATNALPARPLWVIQFFGRAYYGIGNAVYFSDSLSALTISNANFAGVLTLGDSSSTTGASGLAFSTSSAGILSSLAVFKSNSIYQISGDITLTGSNALSLNLISANIGCSSPRTAASTPYGIIFIATDGPRIIDLRGQVKYLGHDEDQLPDVVAPFSNASTPSRACAAYNNSTYRVALDTIVRGNTLTAADFWFDLLFRRWLGPHTFQYHLAVPVGATFYLFSNATPGVMFRSDVIQSAASVYTDNTVAYNTVVQSAVMPTVKSMTESSIVETTIELGQNKNSSSYNVIVSDDIGNQIAQVTVNFALNVPQWGTMVWGNFVWTSALAGNHVTTVAWPNPLVFKKMVILISSTASSGWSVREFAFRYQPLGYVNA